MQDNASIYTAYIVIDWFEDIAILLADHLPFSPDINPIEHIWQYLKNHVLKLYPELNDIGSSKEDIQALEQALIEVQAAIPSEIFQSCLDSMPKRVAAVIAADGWHTKYQDNRIVL